MPDKLRCLSLLMSSVAFQGGFNNVVGVYSRISLSRIRFIFEKIYAINATSYPDLVCLKCHLLGHGWSGYESSSLQTQRCLEINYTSAERNHANRKFPTSIGSVFYWPSLNACNCYLYFVRINSLPGKRTESNFLANGSKRQSGHQLDYGSTEICH